jgi:hypothetical protein
MNVRGPVLTLLAVAGLAAVLFLVNIRTATETASRNTASPATAQLPPATEEPPGDAAGPVPAQQPLAAAQQATYAGRTSGNEATIAIASDNGQVAAYLCDGKQVEAWLKGSVVDGKLTLEGTDARADGSIQDGAVFGMVWVQGRQWPFSAQAADPPAGLYQGRGTVDGAPAQIGWIVLQDGSQVGVAEIGARRQPAPRLDTRQPGAVRIGDDTIVPRQVGGADLVGGPPA